MKRGPVWASVIVFVGAWFFPVVRDVDYTPSPAWLPGSDALLIALGLRHDSSPSVFSVASGLTNGLMIAALRWLLRSPRHRPPRMARRLLAAASLLKRWALWNERSASPSATEPMVRGISVNRK